MFAHIPVAVTVRNTSECKCVPEERIDRKAPPGRMTLALEHATSLDSQNRYGGLSEVTSELYPVTCKPLQ